MTFPSNIHWRALSPSLLLSCSFPSSGMVVRVVCTVASLFVVPVVAVDACLGNSLHSTTHENKDAHTHMYMPAGTKIVCRRTRLQSGKYVRLLNEDRLTNICMLWIFLATFWDVPPAKKNPSRLLLSLQSISSSHFMRQQTVDPLSGGFIISAIFSIRLSHFAASCFPWMELVGFVILMQCSSQNSFGYVRNCDAYFTREKAWASFQKLMLFYNLAKELLVFICVFG